ncbi:unnamed protein product [Lymnaea stagnalis]|uniref:2-aminoethanethiol dioxygenase n=1 Tax=Lymnaea stagnalis TaxID=6523 RepID=A0AAV2HL89_LYMST
MAAPIQKLVSLSSKLFGRLSPEKITKDHLAPLARNMNDITAEDVMFDASEVEKRDLSKQHDEAFDNEIAPVTYMHLHQERTFSMSIFVLKSGGVLPLHDHPKMFGLLKVIHGSVKIISYTEVNQQPLTLSEDEIDMKYRQTRSFYKNIKTVHRNKDIILTESDECCILSPTEGNIHEIHPETKMAAFLDILAPPYDNNDQCCHYYKEMAASKVSDTRWLLEIPQPASYWCDTIDYRGPPLSSYVNFPQRN